MMIVTAVVLVTNVAYLWLVSRHQQGGAHMKASIIFSANDVIANAGCTLAGLAVAVTGSRYPDLVVGALPGASSFWARAAFCGSSSGADSPDPLRIDAIRVASVLDGLSTVTFRRGVPADNGVPAA